MKSLGLSLSVLTELGEQFDVDTIMDENTLIQRWEHEGDHFLTVTLPSFEKALLQCLERGELISNLFHGFRKRNGTPLFLSGFLDQLFPQYFDGERELNPDSGLAAQLVRGLRQLLALHGKTETKAAPKRIAAAKKSFLETDHSLSFVLDDEVRHAFNASFGGALARVERELYLGNIFLRHGPGGVAEKVTQNQKWTFATWPEPLQGVLPWWHAVRTVGEVAHSVGECEPSIVTRPHSRLVDVPKTALTPRLIACEPVAHQFVQQGIADLLTKEISREGVWSSIDWTDQDRNRALARLGSNTGLLATLDLSEASDRVHMGLIQALLSRHRFLLRWIEASRSERIDVDGVLHPLNKFASMGSALTFPLETMVFYAVARAVVGGSAWDTAKGNISKTVSVYGDDIIVPTDKALDVIAALHRAGARVNSNKSFYRGSFRESCGGDYLFGRDVGIVRVRKRIDDPVDPTWLEKTINLRNRLYEAGWVRPVAFLDEILEEHRVPMIPEGTPALGLWTNVLENTRLRWSRHLHRLETRVWRVVRKFEDDPLSGWEALRKCLNPRRGDALYDEKHLSVSGRPRTERIKYGWTAVP